MALDRLIQTLLPHDQKFYTFFEKMAQNLVRGSETMAQIASNGADQREMLLNEVHNIEQQCDTLTHDIFAELDATFVTPFDREDIHILASELDDVMDFMDEAARRMRLYKIGSIPESMKKLINVLHHSTGQIVQGISMLRDVRKAPDLRVILYRIHADENEADDIFAKSIADLFEEEKDPIHLIKLKDIYGSLERATDKCEDVANVLESILIKHA